MTKPLPCAAAALAALLLRPTAAALGQTPAFAHPSASHSDCLPQHHQRRSCAPLAATALDEVPSDAALDDDISSSGGDPEAVLQSRNRLLALARTLADNSPSGTFVSRPADKKKLQTAINELEALAPLPGERERDLLLGDWTLIATAGLPSSNIRSRLDKRKEKRGGWFGKQPRSGLSLFGTDNPLQKSIRNAVEVTQRIRNDGSGESGGPINRVDNVIEVSPLDTLEGVLPEESPLFGVLGNVNVNPLQVKKSKVVLVHKAEVESVKPVLRTKIAWTSSVLNVAGTSQNLDPDGADVFGLNNLLGEFQSGSFDTVFVDEDIRVSRSPGPVLEQLRVFARKGSALLEDEGLLDSLAAELRVEEEKEVEDSESSDVGAQVNKALDATTSMVDNARSTIETDMQDVVSAVGDAANDVVAKVQDAVENDLEQMRDAVEDVQAALREEGGDVGGALRNVTEAVAKVPGDVRDIVEEEAQELADSVEGALDTMVADVQDSVEGDLKEVRGAVEDVQNAATGTGGEVEEEEEEDSKEENLTQAQRDFFGRQ
ncbi:hypothetical protein ACHAXT_006499 [Thalassiosira profunda]